MPKVSLLTPVYNGEQFLQECIESVLSQSYRDFEYIILDNCSTDRTAEIATRYASDQRVRVFRNNTLLPVIANYNRVATFVSPDTQYLKYLAADDLLFPSCLERMVAVAEANPRVSVVASYKVHGTSTECDGPPRPQDVVAGKQVCKWFFEGRLGVLGGPTNHLIKVPPGGRETLRFDEDFLHADIELWVRLLKDGAEYGFVHEVLTFTREHDSSISTTFADRMGTRTLEFLVTLKRHGRAFLSAEEFHTLTRTLQIAYCRWLFRVLLKPWARDAWRYQAKRRDQLDLRVGVIDILDAAVRDVASAAMSPAETIRTIRRAYARARLCN